MYLVVLLSRYYFAALSYAPTLFELGWLTIPHGETVGFYRSLFDADGNPQSPEASRASSAHRRREAISALDMDIEVCGPDGHGVHMLQKGAKRRRIGTDFHEDEAFRIPDNEFAAEEPVGMRTHHAARS